MSDMLEQGREVAEEMKRKVVEFLEANMGVVQEFLEANMGRVQEFLEANMGLVQENLGEVSDNLEEVWGNLVEEYFSGDDAAALQVIVNPNHVRSHPYQYHLHYPHHQCPHCHYHRPNL